MKIKIRDNLVGHIAAVMMHDLKNNILTHSLSQDEIEAIQKELDEAYNKYMPKGSNGNTLVPAPQEQLDLFKYKPEDYNRLYEPFEEEPEKPYKEEKKPKCTFHKWKTYTGLRESFDYCEVCDEKKK